jgi:death-on-curing protein
MSITRFLTIDELVYINDQVVVGRPIHTIVQGKRKVRDMDLLEAAAGRPMQTVFGADAYPTLTEKAAALLHSIARNHPFADGNKRTATVAALFMLEVNGLRVTWNTNDALERITAIAEGAAEIMSLMSLMQGEAVPRRLEPDAACDKSVITRLITEHHWLLSELAQR